MTIPPRPLARLVGVLVVPLLLSGCGGTPFGEALSRSFSGSPDNAPPPGAGTAGPPSASPNPTPTPAPAEPVTGEKTAADKAKGGLTSSGAKPPAAKASSSATPAAPASDPAPYRVTIRLPRADPSAPAEVVTQALRAAGVAFEVETIERMAPDGPSPDPSADTAPASPPASTPRPRPAPAP